MPEIEQWIAENYDAIVADESRAVSYDDVAEFAESHDSPELAGWARRRAAEAGKNTTPKSAKAEPKSKR